MTVEITTAEQVHALSTGEEFISHIGELKWRDAHAIMYHTAKQDVTITLAGGDVIKGRLDETPGYFGGFYKKVWVRIPGRKTRLGVLVSLIVTWEGQKAPSLEEVTTAFIYLNSPGATPEQIGDALKVAKAI